MDIDNINIPKSSGCYIFKNSKGQVIYVGKSKYLPNRVKSYFNNEHTNKKTRLLVEQISDVDFVETTSEREALITEENLIKLYNPKFNIKGKDDRTIRSYIIITNDYFPRIELVKKSDDINGYILGEFTPRKANIIYRLLFNCFALRSCSYNLSEENIRIGKFKSCLEYQIGNCDAPCIGKISNSFYMQTINHIKMLFNFKHDEVIKLFNRRRDYYSRKMEYEKAHIYQKRIESINKLMPNLDILKEEKIKNKLVEIGKALKLSKTPFIIESFDNSHTSGYNGVSCSVRFVMGKPEKSSYRKFLINKDNVGDDCASFEEVLTRRYNRLINENGVLPDLILMDGGKSQLNTANRIINELNLNIDIIGISKDKNHRAKTIHTLDGNEYDIMGIDGKELLSFISDEVHRFTINFHRQRRDKI